MRPGPRSRMYSDVTGEKPSVGNAWPGGLADGGPLAKDCRVREGPLPGEKFHSSPCHHPYLIPICPEKSGRGPFIVSKGPFILPAFCSTQNKPLSSLKPPVPKPTRNACPYLGLRPVGWEVWMPTRGHPEEAEAGSRLLPRLHTWSQPRLGEEPPGSKGQGRLAPGIPESF